MSVGLRRRSPRGMREHKGAAKKLGGYEQMIRPCATERAGEAGR